MAIVEHQARALLSGTRMSTPFPTPEQPRIDETTGKRSGVSLLAVDGLCIALVERVRFMEAAVEDLASAMQRTGSPNGSLMMRADDVVRIAVEDRRRLANRGISVRPARGGALDSEARVVLSQFWARRAHALRRHDEHHRLRPGL